MTAAGHCLQLDVGNSSAKWRLVNAGAVVARGRYVPGDRASTDALFTLGPQPDSIWIASVAVESADEALAELVVTTWGVTPWFARTRAREGGLVNSYSEPSRMGVDRWLAMLGARSRSAGRVCVVDAGSALTIDLVAASGKHEGGYIIPGPSLMERALLLDTDRVRFDENVGYELGAGTSTAAAVRHGIALAQAGAVRLALETAGGPAPTLFFCGGAGETLLSLAGCGGHYVSDLVFEGLEVAACEGAG